jgi:hypothetical protein
MGFQPMSVRESREYRVSFDQSNPLLSAQLTQNFPYLLASTSEEQPDPSNYCGKWAKGTCNGILQNVSPVLGQRCTSRQRPPRALRPLQQLNALSMLDL